MVWIALQLDGPPIARLHQHPAAGIATAAGRGIRETSTGNSAFLKTKLRGGTAFRTGARWQPAPIAPVKAKPASFKNVRRLTSSSPCYWVLPRLVIKVAYQVNDEPGFHLHDNQFRTELAWGW